jgi:outer membrane protein assembly factor BamB
VTLRAGDCIARGESVGKIGAPQHLHFEMRTHTPHTPGPGYWSVEPTLAGWKPPSETIWNYRIAVSPGLVWSWPFGAPYTRFLGQTDDGALIIVQDKQLMGINAGDGSVRWSQTLSSRPKDALLDREHGLVYLTASLGRVQALGLGPVSTPLAAVWTHESKAYGDVALLPLPGGGVIVATEQRISGVSARGEALWSLDTLTPLYDWALTGDGIMFSTRDEHSPLWSVDESGPSAWDVAVGGHLAVSGEASYVYAEDGIYRLDTAARCAELIYALPPGDLDAGDIAPLPAGGLLVVHVDKYDKRLIALNPDGSLRWERSMAAFSPERARFLIFDNQVYVALQRDTRESNLVRFFLIDADSAELAHLFTGGSRRNSSPADTWARAVGDEYALMNIGGGSLVALDPRLALEAVWQATGEN